MDASKDTLGDRMKQYEIASSSIAKIPAGTPVLVRIDGKAFHTWTRGLNTPYDYYLMGVMTLITEDLVAETGAKWGYTQSDEITLLLYANGKAGKGAGEVYFNGKTQKLASVCASLATKYAAKYFVSLALNHSSWRKHIEQKGFPVFDARVFGVPDTHEATNAIYWRVRDAIKNSISNVAMHKLGKKAVETLNQNQRLELCESEWDAIGADAQAGTFVTTVKRSNYMLSRNARLQTIAAMDTPFIDGTHKERHNMIFPKVDYENLSSRWVG